MPEREGRPGGSLYDSDFAFGVDHTYEAYVLWRPHPRVELDAGLFLSPFGVEVYESWRNQNYTRGGVANYVQPIWHTGLKESGRPYLWLLSRRT